MDSGDVLLYCCIFQALVMANYFNFSVYFYEYSSSSLSVRPAYSEPERLKKNPISMTNQHVSISHQHTKERKRANLSELCFLLAELQTICHSYYQRICSLEGDKYDLEVIERIKAGEVLVQYPINRQYLIELGR